MNYCIRSTSKKSHCKSVHKIFSTLNSCKIGDFNNAMQTILAGIFTWIVKKKNKRDLNGAYFDIMGCKKKNFFMKSSFVTCVKVLNESDYGCRL